MYLAFNFSRSLSLSLSLTVQRHSLALWSLSQSSSSRIVSFPAFPSALILSSAPCPLTNPVSAAARTLHRSLSTERSLASPALRWQRRRQKAQAERPVCGTEWRGVQPQGEDHWNA